MKKIFRNFIIYIGLFTSIVISSKGHAEDILKDEAEEGLKMNKLSIMQEINPLYFEASLSGYNLPRLYARGGHQQRMNNLEFGVYGKVEKTLFQKPTNTLEIFLYTPIEKTKLNVINRTDLQNKTTEIKLNLREKNLSTFSPGISFSYKTDGRKNIITTGINFYNSKKETKASLNYVIPGKNPRAEILFGISFN